MNEETFKGPQRGPFLFIVNPHSGRGKALKLIPLIDSFKNRVTLKVSISESPQHTNRLVSEAVQSGYTAVIAVGGDGSVSTVGKALIGTSVALGIVPVGSGNGIARHLGVSTIPRKAIEQALISEPRLIDTFQINGNPAIGFFGVGADALVAKKFDEHTGRGFFNYIKLALTLLPSYKPTSFSISNGRNNVETKALSVIGANVSQLGNNAYINPLGSAEDGMMELVILKPMGFTQLAMAALHLFTKRLPASPNVEIWKSDALNIANTELAPLQIDGEALNDSPGKIEISLRPLSLWVLTPRKTV